MRSLGKYSLGMGDRFAHQGEAQLSAVLAARDLGVDITPVWNKSNREHSFIHSEPASTRAAADNAVQALGWDQEYFVDADHINLGTVDWFLESSDFFTLDVADSIGKKAPDSEIAAFVASCAKYTGELQLPGLDKTFKVTTDILETIAGKFLLAAHDAAAIYNHIASKKEPGTFVIEVSMDEVDEAQSPVELLFILKMLADLGIPARTIAPKFSGRFNKGVDYVGDVEQFRVEFEQDLMAIEFAVKEFGLPADLKLSVHSGSDKFSIYPVMGELIRKHDKGIHVKTAGTTWLEEMIGLALGTEESLDLAKAIYSSAHARRDALCKPYATVIDINPANLPDPKTMLRWSGEEFANTLRHVPGHPSYNPDLRQLVHVAFKVAAEYGDIYTSELKENKAIIALCVKENLLDRHIKRLFLTE